MQLKTKRYTTKGHIVAHGILAIIMIVNVMLFGSPLGMKLIWWGLIVLYMAIVVYKLRIILQMPSEISVHVHEHFIQLNEERLAAEDLSMVAAHGHFRPVVALIPAGRRLAPQRYMFRFASEDELRGMKALREWAERNGVKFVKNKTFLTWI
ncbi:hypothetical protein [Paenibacillus sp. 1P07SE]|uniref:hypothetical protein n=1 Tax=Paenibacillus sp. 1P07SE TaxID=3132209 RepID=UPI0039A61D82